MNDARRAAWRALVLLEERGTRIQEALDVGGLSAADRALAHELALGVARTSLLLDTALSAFVTRGLPEDARLLSVLRLGAYQLMWTPRIAAHAAVHETVALAGGKRGFVNAVLRRIQQSIELRAPDPACARRELSLPEGRTLVLPRDLLPDPEREPARHLAACHGLPSFLVARWVLAHGIDAARRIAASSLATPGVSLRARRSSSAAELAQALAREGVSTEPSDDPWIVRWSAGGSPFQTEAFARGEFIAQDPTAFAAVRALEAQEGETILDLCAAPGTKATWLAECVGPAGRVLAFDASPERRARIAENARRLALPQLVVIDTLEELPKIDRVLADVPCSNTGVLARRVETRRRVSVEAIARIAAEQRQLLAQALALVVPGGHVLYSTCSLEREENEAVVASAGLTPVRELLTLPDPPRRDGGYFALVQRAP